MSCQNERFIFRTAQPDDGKELIEIMEEDYFKGNISLLYTRRPDAYRSLKKEGEEVIIIVYQDTVNKKIVGVGSCAIRKLYVNGKPELVGYLFGLRARKDYRKKFPLLAGAYQALYSSLKDKGIKYYFTTILDDNLSANKLLGKKRKIMPSYEPYGSYQVFTLKTINRAVKNVAMKFRKADKADIALIVQFINDNAKKFQFYPIVGENDISKSNFSGLAYDDFYILFDRLGEILAVGAVWDQKSYKQYIVQGYGGILKYAYPISCLFPLLGYPILPKLGTVLNFFTLSFWAVKDNDPVIFKTLINNISGNIKGYQFFLIGVHQNNPLKEVLKKMPHLCYTSKVYLVNWEKAGSVQENICAELVPYLECGTL